MKRKGRGKERVKGRMFPELVNSRKKIRLVLMKTDALILKILFIFSVNPPPFLVPFSIEWEFYWRRGKLLTWII